MLGQRTQQSVKILLMIQLCLIVMMAIFCWVAGGEKAFYSALLAGGCCVFTTVVFAKIVFAKSGAQAAKNVVRAFYRAEAIKWLLTIVLITLVFAFIPVAAAAFFITFFVIQLSYWLALGMAKN